MIPLIQQSYIDFIWIGCSLSHLLSLINWCEIWISVVVGWVRILSSSGHLSFVDQCLVDQCLVDQCLVGQCFIDQCFVDSVLLISVMLISVLLISVLLISVMLVSVLLISVLLISVLLISVLCTYESHEETCSLGFRQK